MTKELKEAAKLRKDGQQLKQQQLKRRRSESKTGKKIRPDGRPDVTVGPGRAADGLRLPPPVWMGPGLDRGPHTVSVLNVASVSIPQKARNDGRFEIEVKGCDGQHRMVVARTYDEFAAFKSSLTYASSGHLKDVDVAFPPRPPGDDQPSSKSPRSRFYMGIANNGKKEEAEAEARRASMELWLQMAVASAASAATGPTPEPSSSQQPLSPHSPRSHDQANPQGPDVETVHIDMDTGSQRSDSNTPAWPDAPAAAGGAPLVPLDDPLDPLEVVVRFLTKRVPGSLGSSLDGEEEGSATTAAAAAGSRHIVSKNATLAQWFHQLVDRPAAGVRHVFLPVSDEASYQCKAINIDRDLKGSIQAKASTIFQGKIEKIFASQRVFVASCETTETHTFPYVECSAWVR